MGQQFAVADVERLVVDEQADQLSVGDVDDGLAVLRIAVAGFGVGQRARSLSRSGRCREGRSAHLVEACPALDVAVRQREHRPGLREHVEIELVLRDRPRFDGERALGDQSTSPRDPRRRCPPCKLEQRVVLPDAIHADHAAEAARGPPPRLRAPCTRPPRLRRRRAGARPRGRCRGGAGPSDAGLVGDHAVDALLEQMVDPGRLEHVSQLWLDETTARRSPASRAAST